MSTNVSTNVFTCSWGPDLAPDVVQNPPLTQIQAVRNPKPLGAGIPENPSSDDITAMCHERLGSY